MKAPLVQLLISSRMEATAPVAGGGLGILAWAAELAPLISIIAAVTGIILGGATYLLKLKKNKMECELIREQIAKTKNQ